MKTHIQLLWLAAYVLASTTPPLRAQVVNDGATNSLSNVTNSFAGNVFVGTNGSFTLLVLSNNCLLTNSATGYIGFNATARSNEARLVSGSARWFVSGGLVVGYNGGFNRLTVSNGALVISDFGQLSGNSPSASNNSVIVTGTGSVWSNAGDLNLGNLAGGNRLEISDGGWVGSRDGTMTFGISNRILVTGAGSVWSNRNDLVLGLVRGGSQMVVSNGGAVFNRIGYLGQLAGGSNNLALVTGAGSVWVNSSDLYVGMADKGNQLVVSNGATVTASNVFLGFQPSSLDNRIIVDGGTLRANVLDLRRGYSNFLNAGVIEVGHLLNTNSDSRLIFKGGTLAAGKITIANGLGFSVGDGVSPATLHLTGDEVHSFSSVLSVTANARLMGNGSVLVPISIQSGSTLSPGHAPGSIGRLSASSSSAFSGTNILEISKSGTTLTNDRVVVAGTITFVNATILVTHLGPTALAAGDRFQLFAGNSFAGSIRTLSLPPLASGLRWATNLLIDGSMEVESLAPSVTTLPASAVTNNSATLQASANPHGADTVAWFEWGSTTNYGNVTPPQALGSGNVPANFSEAIGALSPSVAYHFRTVASNSFGVVFGADQTFQTFGALVTTLPPSAVTPTTATLNGLINPRGTNTSGWFEWGLTTNYGTRTPARFVGSNNVVTNFSANISGLIPQTVFHFRAVASNVFGVVFGADQRSPRFEPPDYFKASNTGIQDNFGTSVAMSGDTLVVGASGESSNASGVNGDQNNNSLNGAGAVYVFVRNRDSWSQQAYLKASNPGTFDSFGVSVAISGDTVVVGANAEDSNATGVNGDQNDNSISGSGAAYVFVRTGTNWSQQAYLKASNPGAFDSFGFRVAVSGDTVVAGALSEDSNATTINGNQSDDSATNSGAAYVFVRSGTNWSQQAYLKASNAETGTGFNRDSFGSGVAVSGDTIVIGASGEDSNANTINGDQGNNSAADAGAAYVFVRNGTTWTQQAYLKAANAQQEDAFGTSVALADDTVVVGAIREDGTATGVNGDASNNQIRDAGAAYVFQRNGSNWTQAAYLKASNTEKTEQFDFFGTSVAISGNFIVVGARDEDSSATGVNGDGRSNTEINSGAAYAFEFDGTTWAFLAYLKASNTEGLPPPTIGDSFGQAVAVADGFVAAGAPFEASSATGINGDQDNNDANSAGAVYVFRPTPPPAPEISVSESNVDIANGASSPLFAIVGTNVATRPFVIRNSGNDFLTGLTITLSGPDTASFAIATSPVSPVFPTSNTTFTVRFTPTRAGTNTATLRLASNDADENPFTILLNGVPLSFNVDGDGDGLSDASEFLMAPLGFNFQVSQTSLVNTLFNNANGAGLFTEAQLQALSVNSPLLTRDPLTGLFTLTIGIEKSTDLINFLPFPMTAPQTLINAEGRLEFQFSAPDNAAFFRLRAP